MARSESLGSQLHRYFKGFLAILLRLPPFYNGSYITSYDRHENPRIEHDVAPGPEGGFLLMAGVQPAGQKGTPHDHGTTWVVYGIYQGAIEQTKYRWSYPETDRTSPEIKLVESWVQKPGATAFFLPGEIHNTANAADTYGIAARYTDYRTMLETEKPDVVYAVLQPTMVTEIAAEIIEMGHNLFLEKPPGVNVSETRHLAELAAKFE